jgi:uncharacterized protein YjbI with pentapeptide repeats
VVVLALLQTGDANAVSDNAALIGALVALGGVFTAQMVGITLDDRRTQEARDLEAQRAHEAALQHYLEQVGTLLIEQPLRRASPGDNLSTVVRAQTLAVLAGLGPDRKHILLQFLYESGLINMDKPVVSLEWADLSGAELSQAILLETDLSGVNLNGANLSRVNLSRANLMEAFLIEAHLFRAILVGANLRLAFMVEANLSGAHLNGANLNGANLNGANLSGANLGGADLGGADLRGANLSDADLRGADLTFAQVTAAQIDEAKFLEGATMPNGQKYEDRLKDKESHGEDE